MPTTPATTACQKRDAEAQQERAVGQAEDADVRAEPGPEQLPGRALALGLGDDVDAVGLDGDPRGGRLACRVDGLRVDCWAIGVRPSVGGLRRPARRGTLAPTGATPTVIMVPSVSSTSRPVGVDVPGPRRPRPAGRRGRPAGPRPPPADAPGRIAEDAGRAHRPHALGAQPGQERRRSASVTPARRRRRRTPSGSTCNISDVSVRPAWASPPGTPHGNQATSRPSDRSSGTAVRSASRLPPCPLTISTRPGPAAGGAAVLDEQPGQRLGADRDRAGEALVLAAGAVGQRRARAGRRPAPPTAASATAQATDGVGAQRQVVAVLLDRPERDDEQRRLGDLRPDGAGQRGHRQQATGGHSVPTAFQYRRRGVTARGVPYLSSLSSPSSPPRLRPVELLRRAVRSAPPGRPGPG